MRYTSTTCQYWANMSLLWRPKEISKKLYFVCKQVNTFYVEVAMEEYITDTEFQTLMEEILDKLKNNQVTECQKLLEQIMKDAEENEKYIDRTYIGQVKIKKRLTKISEITTMLEKMTSEQIDNVHSYTVNEFDEPNHEAEALEAIVRLSKEHTREKNG